MVAGSSTNHLPVIRFLTIVARFPRRRLAVLAVWFLVSAGVACDEGAWAPDEFAARCRGMASLADELRLRREAGHPSSESFADSLIIRWVDFYLDHGTRPPAPLASFTPGWASATVALGFSLQRFVRAGLASPQSAPFGSRSTDDLMAAAGLEPDWRTLLNDPAGCSVVPFKVLADLQLLERVHVGIASVDALLGDAVAVPHEHEPGMEAIPAVIERSSDDAASSTLRCSDLELYRSLSELFSLVKPVVGPHQRLASSVAEVARWWSHDGGSLRDANTSVGCPACRSLALRRRRMVRDFLARFRLLFFQ